MKKHHRQIAPRLRNGVSRLTWGGRLPPKVKEYVRYIAHQENKSMSWTLEEIVIKFFGIRQPEYVKTKRHLRVVRRKAS